MVPMQSETFQGECSGVRRGSSCAWACSGLASAVAAAGSQKDKGGLISFSFSF